MAKRNHNWWLIAERTSAVLGLVLGVEQVLSLVGFLPGYRVERVRLDNILPIVWQMPGQKLRLVPEFPDGTHQSDIDSVHWELFSEQGGSYKTDGYQPTIVLPPDRGGLFRLKVSAQVRGESHLRRGQRSLYVVQDKGETVKYSHARTVPVELPLESGEPLQVMTASTLWADTQSLTLDQGHADAALVVPAGVFLRLVDGKLIFRRKNAPKDLQSYGTAIAPK